MRYNSFAIKYILGEGSAVGPLSSEIQKKEDNSKSQDSWAIKSNTSSSNLPKKNKDVSEKSVKSYLTMLPLQHLDSERAEPKKLNSSVDLSRDSTVITPERQNDHISIMSKNSEKRIKKNKVKSKKVKKGFLKARQSKKPKERRKNVGVGIDEEDSLHVTMDLGGTTIPAEPSKSEIILS